MDGYDDNDEDEMPNPLAAAAKPELDAEEVSGGGGSAEELVPLPDFFARFTALLCAADGSPSMLVRFAPASAVFATVWWFFSFAYSFANIEELTGGDPEAAPSAGTSPISQFAVMMQGFTFNAPSYYAVYLHRVLEPNNGALALLGARGATVPASTVKALKLWRNVLLVPVFLMAMFGIFGFGPIWTGILAHNFGGMEWGRNWQWIRPAFPALVLTSLFGLPIGYSLAAVWYLAMKVGVVLAEREVEDVIAQTTPQNVVAADPERWVAKVAAPATRLATQTMKQLSEGWGSGTGAAAVIMGVASLVQFVRTVHTIIISVAAGELAVWTVLRTFASMCVAAMAPFLLASDAAAVSTRCDVLRLTINDLRLDYSSDAQSKTIHERTYPLQLTLAELNHGQGLGFLIFGHVIDSKSLRNLLIAVLSFYSTAIPLILALLPDPTGEDGVGGANATATCEPTPQQVAVVRALFASADSNCSFANVTVGSMLGM